MRLIRPTTLTDAMLTSSTAPETDYPAWSSATAYAVGARVILTATHRRYEALAASTNVSPSTDPTKWLDLGPTNRWAMFDARVGTATSRAASLQVGLAPGAIDALALIEALGYPRAHLVGHDWGASAAYAAANMGPDRIDRLVTMAVPYGPQVSAAFLMDGDQQRRSWYMFFFQLDLASLAVPMNDYALIDRLWAEWSPGFSLPEADRLALKQMFAQPGVLDQTLTYYRQLFSTSPPAGVNLGGPISAPTLYIHGLNDGCMGASLTKGMANRFTGGFRLELIDGAGHFLHLEQPRRVADLITDFLGEAVPAP
jgi:pimeloyl-ACP methyl ester carboxylesterase